MTNSIALHQALEEKIKGASCLIPGQLVDNKYRVKRCLGTGTMGEVYLCSHVDQRGALYAMKVLRLSDSDLEANPDMLTRFENEAKTSYVVDHPNVVGSYSFIRTEGLVAFTMEYIPGGDLADCISAERCLSIENVIKILYQACRGVMAIHSAGIVHRDLKPENLLLTQDGNVKITDFGIARIEHSQRLTAHGGLLGTVDYLSPEYLLDGICDERSDLYALGLIGYEMLTGYKPFKGDSVVETLRNKLEAKIKPPHRSRPTCPRTLSDIVLKALEREPELRYQSAEEMLSDLEPLASPVRARLRKLMEIEPSPVIAELGNSGPTLSSSGNLPTTDLKSHIKVPKIVTGIFGCRRGNSGSLRSVAMANNRKSFFGTHLRNFFLNLGELPFRIFWGFWRGPLFGSSRIGEITFLSILAAASLVVATSFFLP